MSIRYPAPLQPGDRIGVTSPSAGIGPRHQARLEFCVEFLRAKGYDVVVGECMDGTGLVSAPPAARAAELTAMLTDPAIKAVVPPWGGDLAIDLMPHLDFGAIADADPTWLVGFSDMSTVLLALTTLTGIATLHGQNLMDTPYRVPEPLLPWLDVASSPAGARFEQGAAAATKSAGFDDWTAKPDFTEWTLTEPGGWRLLDPAAGPVRAAGRLIGGCVETAGPLAGTPYGDVRGFAEKHAPEGLIVYVEVGGSEAGDIARLLWSMRLAGWFDHANAILTGRTRAPGTGAFTQDDAVRSALGDLGVPVVMDVDCGHIAPHLALVNGALAEVTADGAVQRITQSLT
ncbi:S66 family peptidase [Longispora albida]|uniref:S66 family peptidase n=1 Tax=Longispora albida TaxID=203523 RepID=UPI00036CCC9A|nr:S66 peptidase family protein [Longispora albida]